MPIENCYNFRPITADLTTSGVVGTQRLQGLSAEGYEVVINLLPDNSEQAVADERDIVESQGMEYVHIPVDFQHPTAADFQTFARSLDTVQGRKVHIHCAANYRVSAFYAHYAKVQGLWSETEAEAFVRGLWEPQDYPGWPEFLAALKDAI